MAKTSYQEQAGILVLGKFLATIGEAAMLLVIVRLLGKIEVGLLAGLLLIYQTIALVLTTGFPDTLMFHLPTRGVGQRRAIAVKVALVLCAMGVLAGLLLVGLSRLGQALPGMVNDLLGGVEGGVDEDALGYLALLALLPVADLPARMLPNLLIVEERPRAAAAVQTISSLVQSLSIVLPLALGLDLWVVVGCLVAGGYLNGALLVIYLIKMYGGVEREPTPVTALELFRFAIPLGMTSTISLINNRLDRYLILVFLPIAQFAEYQAGAWQIPLIQTIPAAVATAYTPRFAELFKAGRPAEAIAVWRQSIEKVALIVVPVAMVFVVAAEETMAVLFTEDYVVAAWVFRFYALFTMARVAAFGNVIVAAGRPRYVLASAAVTLGSNALISLPLVLVIGFEGPALGTLLAIIPTIAAYCWFIAKASGLPFRSTFPLVSYGRVLAMAALAALPALAIKLSLDLPVAWLLVIEALCVLAIFALLGTLFRVIGRDDWAFLGNWLRLKVLFAPGR